MNEIRKGKVLENQPVGESSVMWKCLFDRLIRQEGNDLIRPPKEKIEVALKRYEKDIGIRLSKGYKAFIHQFGPGEIGGYFRIYGPLILGF